VLRLAVAIVRAPNPNPAPDPLVLLNGGPGGQAMQDLEKFIKFFQFLIPNPDRDVILFDQRGVGASQPALECPELAPMLLAQAMGRALTTEELQAPYRACRDRWVGQGVNLAVYTTADSAADVNDLWRTLGYKEVNLYGISYGTVLAQTVMRDYPDGLRSVVLDSAYPLQISLFADTAPNLSGHLKRVFAECAADWLCRMTYPDLEKVFYDLLDQLNRAPVKLALTNPATDEPFTFDFDGAEFVNVIQAIPPRLIPATVYDLRVGDSVPIEAPTGAWMWRRGRAVVALNLSDQPVGVEGVDGAIRLSTRSGREDETVSGALTLAAFEGVVVV